MDSKTYKALEWIVEILSNNNISYRVGGGTAAYIYGSGRKINDIDISMSGKDFDVLVPLVKEYIVAGPKHYKNEKWDCTTLSLNYEEQDIDLTDVDTLKMTNKGATEWLDNKLIYNKYPDVVKKIQDLEVVLMHPRVLIEYKNELRGEHQESDIAFLEEYIETNKL
ncbi:hypothetical protein H6785_01160 [Candidatus Nomurabacteria bacterium]|nr:hypothetical protein [Candidatus Nomurabacteria bacterium]